MPQQDSNNNTNQAKVETVTAVDTTDKSLTESVKEIKVKMKVERADNERKVATRKRLRIVRLYIIPLSAVIFFFFIFIGLILPNVGNIFALLDEISSIRESTNEVVLTTTELQRLSEDTAQIVGDLALVNQIAPAGVTQVVVFQQKIATLARQFNLRVLQTQTGEQRLLIENDNPILGINEIPSTFSVTGKISNIRGFIQEINQIEDFVIIGELTIRALDGVSVTELGDPNIEWNMEVTLVKYQFLVPDEQNKLAEAYFQVPPTSKIDEEILEFVRAKFSGTTSGLDQNQAGLTGTDQGTN